ncbi:DUF5667 domain-containing protein [Actinacidiphila bryophytorum]|uniref:DUF5667 domain-containing protein n=2 Tax=Actinacidiphila bryophytorum TaxID=1436133 RepID=A0A9W4E0X5_9ACTN|nr:DUF5667 domain-containing protein [Actinacidiphila bryophytorum]MBM9438963.1 hypothetical protein [Actinacidiphila bryophytorum]CAG7596302.1 conserved hypothetical protein [Actinacidiphila bryophytorum]
MIGQATAHRRANAFAQALEDAAAQEGAGAPERQQGGHAHGSHAAARHADPEQGALLALATALTEQPRPVLDPERKTVQRAQLIAAMEQALADGSFPATARVPEQRGDGQGGSHRLRKLTPTSKLSRRLAVGGLTVGVAAGAFGGVAAASTNALPGDTLYGLKRGMEDLKLDMANGDASRGKVYLDMASTRLQEARRLMDRGRGGPLDDESVSEVRKALSGMHQEASEGHRLLSQAYQEDGSLQPIETLNSFSAAHRQGWTDLRGKLPSQLTDVSEQVSSVFDAIDQEVAPLQALLPQPKKGERTHGGGGSSDSGPSGGSPAAPSASAPATPEDNGAGTQSASPTPSGTTPADGLIGGTNPLGPLPTLPTPDSPSPSIPSGHSVTLPPLLPGLLPGLGLGTTTDDEG